MEQQTQPQAPVEPATAQSPQQPSGQTPPTKSGSKVWLWILGGCLVIVIVGMLIMGVLAWWGAKKVKKAIKENQPKWEEIQKDAEKWQESSEEMQEAADEWQREMEKIKDQLPSN